MATLKVLKYPDEFLYKISKPITEFDSHLHQLLDDMKETMNKSNGIGLAAVQVGRLLRACIILTKEGPIELVNPVIVHGDRIKTGEEACISIPKFQTRIKRFHEIIVNAQDRYGKPFEQSFKGITAVCVQHELDHMEGILISPKQA